MNSHDISFKIVSTLGPASLSSGFLKKSSELDQTCFRMNASHLTKEQILDYHNFVSHNLAANIVEYYLDLPGKKMRIGNFSGECKLQRGENINLIKGVQSYKKNIAIPHEIFFTQVELHDLVLLQDAQIQLKVTDKENDKVRTEVIQEGYLRSRAGITINKKIDTLRNHLAEQLDYIITAKDLNIQYLALSFIASAVDINELRESCAKISYSPKIIAKIEHPSALNNLKSILNEADEIWYCRGDLGSIISPWELKEWQNRTIQEAKTYKKPVCIAGQVFEHLTEHPYPTRSEVIHFLKLVQEGIQGIVLSDETAIGKNSINALEAVASLLRHPG